MAGKHASTQADDQRSEQPQPPPPLESEILNILDERRARRA